tara:strand:- start:90 stop:347 length:258 start_codon:yes stop_codon:yes gene_type:complete
MSNIIKAILKINPQAEVSVSADDINNIVWENGTTPISKTDIEAMIPVVEQETKDAADKKIADNISAENKLKSLGLTDDEIKAFRS